MSAIFDRIDRLQKELQSLLPMKPEDKQRLDEKIRLEFNYNSNHMEGNTLTYGETKLLLIFGETNGKPHDVREIDEMRSHDVAFKLIQEWASDKEKILTEADIRNLNEIILVQPFYKDAITPDGQDVRRLIQLGQYKEYPNSVRLQNGEIFNYASPAETPMLMGDLIQWFREEQEKKELHPVALAALFHYKFVCIHPFDDGNGRISRLLTNYVLLKNDLPPVVIKSDAKKDYLNALHLADIGNLEAFISYVNEQLLWSFDIYLKAAKGESVDELGDLDKKFKAVKDRFDLRKDTKGKSKEVLIECCQKSIIPLLEIIDDVLMKFDDFFLATKRGITLQTTTGGISGYIHVDNLSAILKEIKQYPEIRGIYLACFYTDLKKITTNVNLDVDISIDFDANSYSIVYSLKRLLILKKYDEIISKLEAQEIAEEIGNDVLNKIEKALQS